MRWSSMVATSALVSCGAWAPVPPPPSDAHAWLVGTWERTEGDRVTRERWEVAADGSLSGRHEDVRGGELAFFEDLSIRNDARETVYVAKPSFADAPTRFTRVFHDERSVRFENRDHDWPTDIGYALSPDGALTATASGGERTATWTFTRAP